MKQVGDASTADPTGCASYQDHRSEFQLFSVTGCGKDDHAGHALI